MQPWHVAVIVVVGLLIFGPDKLPGMIKDGGRMLRQLRRMATDVREDLTEELGPEIGGLDLKSMHPKALIHKHLLDPALDEEPEPTVPAAVPSTPSALVDLPSASTPLGMNPPAAAAAAPAFAVPTTPYDLDAT